MKKAIYAFSGDPITFGHLDIIERAAKVFDKLIIAIGINPAKKYLFTLEERTLLAQRATAHLKNIEVVCFRGLLVDFAYEHDIQTIIRGLRNNEDFNFELMFHQIGESQQRNIDTFFIPSRQDLLHISSSAAKAIQLEQGLIHEYVPLNVKQKLEEKLSGQFIIGVSGEIGAGKSFVCNKLIETGKENGIEIHRIDLDSIGHDILETLTEPVFVTLRTEIADKFGIHLLNKDKFIDVKALGKIIFTDIDKLQQFNILMYNPMLLRIRRALYGKKGIILLDSALIAEAGMSRLCNNNVILVKTSTEIQRRRLHERNYSEAQLSGRMASQLTFELKKSFIQKEILKNDYGTLLEFDNNDSTEIKSLFEKIESMLGLSIADNR